MTNRNRLAFKRLDYEYRDLGELPIPLDANTGLFTSPFVQMVGGKDANNAVMPFKIDSTGRLDVIGVCPEHQADATLDQTNPVSGTKYEIIPETEYVRIIGIAVKSTWTVQDTIDCHITIDGVTITASKGNNTSNTYYYPLMLPSVAGFSFQTWAYGRIGAFLLEGRSVKVEAESTGGTVSNLSARVKWARW